MKHSMMTLITLYLLVNSIGFTQAKDQSTQGISFYILRVIYPENQKQGVTLTIYNKALIHI